MVYREKIKIDTVGHRDMHEMTNRVQAIVGRSGIADGTVHVFNVGSTGIIGTIEYEPGLEKDLPDMLDRLIPSGLDYGHECQWHDGNGHSHLQATLMGAEITVPVGDGRLMLGTWQQIFHLEADIKPHSREVVVTVIGE
ncbi:secondary thiamine-phosphate synthase enzyme YjbQ [Pontiella agarivorans]|uniref:Secondary thiamine-phosphate synthase enzyme YjbQ n=1 Tax=Pontiella agarivorans TaxID=3038953 RepID=A0ABU5MXS1_9BACT|nr:secondary thiamine-phosphate synthase enzyme YjbQ [Pontiella agarivorans]MDZ8118998.1 secondary thiamine-phosphate synthase enzyme YjbQ [Pontiella agarivorans]